MQKGQSKDAGGGIPELVKTDGERSDSDLSRSSKQSMMTKLMSELSSSASAMMVLKKLMWLKESGLADECTLAKLVLSKWAKEKRGVDGLDQGGGGIYRLSDKDTLALLWNILTISQTSGAGALGSANTFFKAYRR